MDVGLSVLQQQQRNDEFVTVAQDLNPAELSRTSKGTCPGVFDAVSRWVGQIPCFTNVAERKVEVERCK